MIEKSKKTTIDDTLTNNTGFLSKIDYTLNRIDQCLKNYLNQTEAKRKSKELEVQLLVDKKNDIVANPYSKTGVVDGKILTKHPYIAFMTITIAHFVGFCDIDFSEYAAVRVCKGVDSLYKKFNKK